MILKEIKIRNFRSYYGNDNRFELSPGLTLILGDIVMVKPHSLRHWSGYSTLRQKISLKLTFPK